MANRSVTQQLTSIMREYADGVGEITVEESMKVAKEAVNRLKAESPEKTGDYRKGWKVKNVDGNIIIHNSTNYQLTHLLEKGHLKRNGMERVDGQVHILPVEQQAINDLLANVERRLG